MAELGEVIATLEQHYDPRWAESWDAVGLVCGDPDAAVDNVHLAVDPVAATVDEAIAAGAQLLVTHHPLYLRGTTSVAASTAKGRLVHRLISNGIGLYVAHTNADVADPGVSDALAAAIGVRDVEPLDPRPGEPQDKLVTFAPADAVDRILDALAAAGAGTIGDYTRCAYLGDGTGTFLPGKNADPTIGTRDRVERTPETRLEIVLPRARRHNVVRALLDTHPYEEPAYDVFELAMFGGRRGLGRVGTLAGPTTLDEFTRAVASSLPSTAWGVRAAGDPRRPVSTVAVCGGSGGELAAVAARAGADVLVTADLRHHPASENAEDGGVALVDAAHWATEWPWLGQAAALLTTVETTVSTAVTDPWTVHAHQTEET
ncbi:MAG TPA: Nif3-like dinuclear metal center hexameric protein [Mycobacteriales bacterium]|nr:Nif3-like dinuclear metal center hexameric protein [Mycobacteriales bacterium]